MANKKKQLKRIGSCRVEGPAQARRQRVDDWHIYRRGVEWGGGNVEQCVNVPQRGRAMEALCCTEQQDRSPLIGCTSATWAALPFLAVPNGAVNSSSLAGWQAGDGSQRVGAVEEEEGEQYTSLHCTSSTSIFISEENSLISASYLHHLLNTPSVKFMFILKRAESWIRGTFGFMLVNNKAGIMKSVQLNQPHQCLISYLC